MTSFGQQSGEIFGRVIRGSRHWVGVITESLGRQGTMQKLAGQIRGLKRARSEVIRTIGTKVYSLHTRGKVRNRDVLSDCRRIDEIGQEIETLQQQIEEMRRQAAAGEELVVEIEDEAPLTEEAEEEEAAAEPPEEQAPQSPTEPAPSSPESAEPQSEPDW